MIRVDEPTAQEHHQGAPPEEGGQRCSENRSEDEMDGGPHGTAIIFPFIKITASRSDQALSRISASLRVTGFSPFAPVMDGAVSPEGASPNDALAVASLRLDLMPVTTFGTEPSDQQHLSSPPSPKIRWTPSREGYRSSSTPSWGRRSRNCGRRRARR